MSKPRSGLVLVIAPIGRDAELISQQLEAAGIQTEICKDVEDLCSRIPEDAAVIVMTEEALPQPSVLQLASTLSAQPAWSEIPIVILTGAPSLEPHTRSFAAIGRRTNVTLVDRPVRIKSLVSAVQSALRARQRQYDQRDLMAQLEDRIHERDRFLAVLGHELRNPLGAILLASQMRDDDGRLDGDHAQLIERQSRHLTQLVNDLLDLSRVAAGKIILKQQTVDLREIAGEAVSVARPAAARQRVVLQCSMPEQPLLIDADPVRIDQIMTNVIGNAIKYTPEGGHVSVLLEREGEQALIRVVDDGVGIAPERIDGVFELFAQAENAIGRAQGGMGIGLALVRNLVHLHNGSVFANSDGVGKGSEFTIRLPLSKFVERRVERRAQIQREEEHDGRVARSIVIVEDNDDVRDLLGLKLRRLGHNVASASDGVAGLETVLEQQPDLALVDLGLPGIDGFEVAKEIRQKLGDDVVLIAVSGFGQPDDKRRALEAGFDEHITKPADVHDIENVLKRFPPRVERPRQGAP